MSNTNFTRSMSYGKGNKEEQISRLKTEIKEADTMEICKSRLREVNPEDKRKKELQPK